MKKILFALSGFLFAASFGIGILQAQNSQTPRAYGDKNGDGICDITGQPVGQGRGQGGPALNPNCPRYGQSVGKSTGLQARPGMSQKRGGMGRCVGRR